MSNKAINCRFENETDRAVAYDDNKCEVGVCTFSRSKNYWVIDHTFVDPSLRGQGVASSLVTTIVNQARNENVKIIPKCSYAKKVLEKSDEYKDVLQ